MMMTTVISREGENDAPSPQYSISQRLFGEAVLGLSQVQPVTHQALMMMMVMMMMMTMIMMLMMMLIIVIQPSQHHISKTNPEIIFISLRNFCFTS